MQKKWWDLLKLYGKEHFIEKNSALELLLKQDFNELMINSWQDVFIEKEGKIKRKEGLFYSSEDYKKQLQHFLTKYNKRLSIDKPIVSFELNGFYRVHLINENLSRGEAIMTVRKHRVQELTKERVIESGFLTESQCDYLEKQVKERKNIFISGETSSGKTTLLNFLLSFVDKSHRIVVIEDTREIKVRDQLNAVFLKTREEEYSLKQVTGSDLLKASLRMRPDRIIVGEIRRDEVVDFLHAISTGHRGSFSTGHGSDARDMLNRLEMLLVEAKVPLYAARGYLGHGIDLIIQLGGKKRRRVSAISEVTFKEGELIIDHVKALSDPSDLPWNAELIDSR